MPSLDRRVAPAEKLAQIGLKHHFAVAGDSWFNGGVGGAGSMGQACYLRQLPQATAGLSLFPERFAFDTPLQTLPAAGVFVCFFASFP